MQKNKLYYFGLYSDINHRRIIKYPDNCFHAIDIIYKYSLENKQDLKKSKESLDIKFFPFNNLPKDIVPPAESPIDDFIQIIK